MSSQVTFSQTDVPPSRKRPRSAFATFRSRTRKRARRTVPLVRMPRYIIGRTQRARLLYHENVNITTAAVAESVGSFVFSANGCYDPNITGVGHQPRGFDQVMALYDHYTVIGASISVRFINHGGNNRPYVGILVRDGTPTATTTRDVFEDGNKVISMRPLLRSSATDEAGEGMTTALTTKVNIAKFLGRKEALSDPELKGGVTTNPTEQVFFHVVVTDPATASANNVHCQVAITYDVIFHEPKNPGAS